MWLALLYCLPSSPSARFSTRRCSGTTRRCVPWKPARKTRTRASLRLRKPKSLLGKAPDGPGSDFAEGARTFTKTTYTWRGALRSYTLAAYYTKGPGPCLHHFESEGAKFEPEPAPKAPSGPGPASPGPTSPRVARKKSAPPAVGASKAGAPADPTVGKTSAQPRKRPSLRPPRPPQTQRDRSEARERRPRSERQEIIELRFRRVPAAPAPIEKLAKGKHKARQDFAAVKTLVGADKDRLHGSRITRAVRFLGSISQTRLTPASKYSRTLRAISALVFPSLSTSTARSGANSGIGSVGLSRPGSLLPVDERKVGNAPSRVRAASCRLRQRQTPRSFSSR